MSSDELIMEMDASPKLDTWACHVWSFCRGKLEIDVNTEGATPDVDRMLLKIQTHVFVLQASRLVHHILIL